MINITREQYQEVANILKQKIHVGSIGDSIGNKFPLIIVGEEAGKSVGKYFAEVFEPIWKFYAPTLYNKNQRVYCWNKNEGGQIAIFHGFDKNNYIICIPLKVPQEFLEGAYANCHAIEVDKICFNVDYAIVLDSNYPDKLPPISKMIEIENEWDFKRRK